MKKSLGPKTIIYPTPVLIVASYDKDDRPNMMAVAWGGVCCSKPPCVAISLRKATYTYHSIVERKAFTVNIPSEKFVKEADLVGMVSGKEEDKFSLTGLTPVKSDVVDAPYVKEFSLILECKLLHSIEIGLHTQFIGEIIDTKADESVLTNMQIADIEKIKPILFAPDNRSYYGIGLCLGKAFSIGKDVKSG
ncbi:flavin reductase family protein [bacterium]|nr:flavin reductase family protein [bacterium]